MLSYSIFLLQFFFVVVMMFDDERAFFQKITLLGNFAG